MEIISVGALDVGDAQTLYYVNNVDAMICEVQKSDVIMCQVIMCQVIMCQVIMCQVIMCQEIMCRLRRG